MQKLMEFVKIRMDGSEKQESATLVVAVYAKTCSHWSSNSDTQHAHTRVRETRARAFRTGSDRLEDKIERDFEEY